MSLVVESGLLEQVDRGADNLTSYIPNHHENVQGRPRTDPGCSAIDDDDDDDDIIDCHAETITSPHLGLFADGKQRRFPVFLK
jgi:hypothetical protein